MKILRVITRLNVGGPARQAIALTARLNGGSVHSLLVSGRPEEDEGDLGGLADQARVRRRIIRHLGRSIHPWRDVLAFAGLLRMIWKERPTLIHTHLAKAGALGRTAGMFYNQFGPGRRRAARAVLVHTFHGHVLEGYFRPAMARLFVIIERWLAHRTDCLIAISPTIRDQLLAKGIGRATQWRVIPLGFDLESLRDLPLPGRSAPVSVGIVGRLVPIKNPGLFLQALARVKGREGAHQTHGMVVGDGPLRRSLEREVADLALGDVVRFMGWQHDLRELYERLDVACVTSWNEGTPGSLIEAMAAARAVVATDVGGVRDLLDGAGQTSMAIAPGTFQVTPCGVLVRPGDADGLANALCTLILDETLRHRLGQAARAHVLARYTEERLVRDIEALYESLHAGGPL